MAVTNTKFDPTKPMRLVPSETFYDGGNAYPGANTLYRPGELPSSLFQYCRNDGDDLTPIASVVTPPQVTVIPSKPSVSPVATLPDNPHKLNINTASSDDIDKVDGITLPMVNGIVAERGKKPFTDAADLIDRVPKLKNVSVKTITNSFVFS